jgi:hypothetical protein
LLVAWELVAAAAKRAAATKAKLAVRPCFCGTYSYLNANKNNRAKGKTCIFLFLHFHFFKGKCKRQNLHFFILTFSFLQGQMQK